MPTIELIDPSDTPTVRRGSASRLRVDCTETLRRALRANQSIKLTLRPDERAASLIVNFRLAAKDLGIAVLVIGAEYRIRQNASGKDFREAGVLYIRITKAAAAARDTGARPPVPISIPAATIERPLRGLEVSR